MAEGELYRVSNRGEQEELVTGTAPREAAERYIQKHGTKSGIVCVREPNGKEWRFFIRKRKRGTTAVVS